MMGWLTPSPLTAVLGKCCSGFPYIAMRTQESRATNKQHKSKIADAHETETKPKSHCNLLLRVWA